MARAAATGASALSRAARLGSGTVIGGRVALALDPPALAELGRGRVLACVSGTNGKTTTTRLLATALSRLHPVVSNSSGANLPSGLVGVLGRDLDRRAVLEVDELYLDSTIKALRPRIVVLLNLTRDQLDRTAETSRPAQAWRRSLSGADQQVVASCDDPRVVWAAGGASRVVWVATGRSWTGDSQVCPQCGHPLRHAAAGAEPGRGSDWYCPDCHLRRPEPAARS